MNSLPRCMTWAECYAAGMTAPEAAKLRGVKRSCAYSWSARVGVTWPKPPSAMRCPVRIRDVDYPSVQAAAEAMGVNQSCVSRHLTAHGHADLVGTKRQGGQFGRRVLHLENPVVIGAREWPSRKALASYIGWHPGRVSRALGKAGTQAMLDRVLAAIMAADARQSKKRVQERDIG